MEINKLEDQEFEILGFKVRFKSRVGEHINAKKVVEIINREANVVRKQNPSLENGQVLLLVSLKMAADKLTLENELKDSVERVRSAAADAMNLIDEITPTPTPS